MPKAPRCRAVKPGQFESRAFSDRRSWAGCSLHGIRLVSRSRAASDVQPSGVAVPATGSTPPSGSMKSLLIADSQRWGKACCSQGLLDPGRGSLGCAGRQL